MHTASFNLFLNLGVFYYILGNIRPIFQSNLQNIQLVTIAKSADIKKYGCDTLLQPFIDQMNALGKVTMHNRICTLLINKV